MVIAVLAILWYVYTDIEYFEEQKASSEKPIQQSVFGAALAAAGNAMNANAATTVPTPPK